MKNIMLVIGLGISLVVSIFMAYGNIRRFYLEHLQICLL
jgi:flagellar biosynthesis protein FliQ